MKLVDEIIEKIRRKTRIDATTECWLYSGPFAGAGYGQISYQLRRYYIHRVAAAKYLNVPIDGSHVVAHRCDVPNCWNPNHLFITTQAGNLADMMEKDRGRFLARERSDICVAGHPRTPENTYEWKGKLYCLPCKRAHSTVYNEKHKIGPAPLATNKEAVAERKSRASLKSLESELREIFKKVKEST